MTSKTRIRYLRAAAALLTLSGVAAVICGVGAWMISGCCGSPEPAEEGYLVFGVVAAVALWSAAYWCFTQASSRR